MIFSAFPWNPNNFFFFFKEAQALTVLVLDISNKRDPKAPGQAKHKYFIKLCLVLYFLNLEDDRKLYNSEIRG